MSIQKTTKFLIYFTIFLIPFYFFRFKILGISTNIFEIFVLLSAIATLCLTLSAKIKLKFGSIWPYLFLFAAFISIFFADDKVRALGIFKGWFFAPFLLYFSIINTAKKETWQNLIWPLVFSSTIIVVLALLQKIGIVTTLFYQAGDQSFLPYLAEGRLFGMFESPNYLAMYLAPVTLLSLILLIDIKNRAANIFILFFSILASYIVSQTGSRGGLFSLIAAILITFVYLIYKLAKGKIDSSKVIYVGILTLFVIFSTVVFFCNKNNGSDIRAGSNQSRKEIYSYTLQMIKDKPIKGIGLGDFHDRISIASSNNEIFQAETLPYALHPHNIFLAFWVNIGLFGLICFLAIIILFFKKVFTSSSNFAILLGLSLGVILTHGLIDTTYFKNDLSAIFWLILGIMVIYKDDFKAQK